MKIGSANIVWTDYGCITTFADGTSWGALPHDHPDYYEIAKRCGYDDIMDFCRDHDALHLAISEWYGYPSGSVIWELAHGMEPNAFKAAQEEAFVQAVTRYINLGERPIISGDWPGLKKFCLGYLKKLNEEFVCCTNN